MAEKVPFKELAEISGVIGAVRWQPTHLGKTVAPPRLIEFIGDIKKDRAERLMAHAEAGGLALFGIGQLSYHRSPGDNSVVYPIDAYYAHGQYTSVVATINRVAILIDNEANLDIQALSKKMILVDN